MIAMTIGIVNVVSPKITYFAHISHQIKHKETELTLPPNIRWAYNGISFVL